MAKLGLGIILDRTFLNQIKVLVAMISHILNTITEPDSENGKVKQG